MASAMHVLNASRSIFDTVGFKPERLTEKYSPQRRFVLAAELIVEEDEAEEYGELLELERLSLFFKLWLRRIRLTEQGQRKPLQDFEHEIYKTHEEVIKPFKVFLISRKPKDQKDLPMFHHHYQRLTEACQKLLTEMNKVNFKMPEEDLKRLDMETVFVCSVLGLQLDFLDGLEEMPQGDYHHRTLCEWIEMALEDNIDSVKTEVKNTLTRELLASIGFDPLSSGVETIITRSFEASTQNHIEACEWAEIFIKDEFKYNPLLSHFYGTFPFQIPSIAESENKYHESISHVNIMSVATKEWRTSKITPQTKLSDFEPLPDEQHVILFHGTDQQSVANILGRGIYLCAGRQKRDFSCGRGFYLMKNMDEALNWAKSTTAKPAILAFKVNREYLDAARKLNLNENEGRWREIVSSFRSGRRTAKTRKALSSYDLIEGPMATVMRGSETSQDLVLEPKPLSYQMCLISREIAETFQKSLHSVLFFYFS